MTLLDAVDALRARVPVNGDLGEEIDRLQAGARHCLSVMQSVADGTRSPWDEPAEVDFNAVVTSALEPVMRRLHLQGMTVDQKLTPNLALVRVSRREVEHLVRLLLRNAATPGAPSSLSVFTIQANRQVTLLVSSPAIDELLEGGDSADWALVAPSNTELAMCQKIVRRWGGDLRFIAAQNGGLIRAWLPAVIAKRAA